MDMPTIAILILTSSAGNYQRQLQKEKVVAETKSFSGTL